MLGHFDQAADSAGLFSACAHRGLPARSVLVATYVRLTSPMERMTGFLGDRIVVNGQADFRLRVAQHPYRLRILNGLNSRIYRLACARPNPTPPCGRSSAADDHFASSAVAYPYQEPAGIKGRSV